MKRICFLFVAFLLLPTCAKKSTGPTGPNTTPEEFMSILEAAGKVIPLAEDRDDVTTTSEEDNGYRYTYEMHDAVENLESIFFYGLNDDIVWPGNLVKGDQAHNFVYEPIMAPRAPITLSISLESSSIGGDLSERIDNPSLSRVRQGISNLVDRVFTENTSVPAQVDFAYQQVYNQSHMNLFVDADISFAAGSLSTAFNWDESSTTNKIMAKYQQIYYSIDMDTPTSPQALFDPGITPEQLNVALPAGSRPLYVASVKYGMMAIMCIETQFSGEQMQMALDAAYSGAVDIELEFGYTAQEVLSSSSIRIIVYGGSTSGIQELNGYDDFWSIISASTDFSADSPGVPIVYKFRHVVDNTLALVTLTSQYTIVRPLQIEQHVRVSSVRFICEWSHDDDPFYDADVDMNRFSVWGNAFDCADALDPGVQINPVNESIFSWSTPDYYEMHAGSIFDAVGAITLVFDTENYNFEFARLQLGAYARDYDWASANESATGTIELIGSQMWGAHDIMLYGADFRFRLEIIIEPLN